MESVVSQIKEYVLHRSIISNLFEPDPSLLRPDHHLRRQGVESAQEPAVDPVRLLPQTAGWGLQALEEATSTAIDLSHDDPHVLALLIHYFYNFALPPTLASDASETHLPTLLVRIYAIADKYNVQPLLTLVHDRLASICHPAYLITNIPAYVTCVRAVDENTSDTPALRGGLWGILLFVARANMGVLLKEEGFREGLREVPTFVVALLQVQMSGWDQAWQVVPKGEEEREMDGERLGREYALGAAYEDGDGGPAAALPMD